MASTSLSRTLGTSTNTYKGTVSVWFKKSILSSDQVIYGNYTSGTQRAKLVVAGDGNLMYYQNDGGSVTIKLETTRLLRDYGAWYHVVLSVDTTQGTAADRVKLYVNGVQETYFDTATYPNQNTVFYLNANSVTNYIGQEGNSSDYWDGSMSHIHVVDGTAYPASTFGSTDSTTGEWSINTSPSITMGTNGFTILKDGNTITDQSSNSNDFSLVGGTLTSNKDCPDNNFATWNNLYRSFSAGYASAPQNGMLYVNSATSNYHFSVASTLAFKGSGKFYWEYKIAAVGSETAVGISETDEFTLNNNAAAANYFWNQSQGYAYKNNGDKLNNNSTASYGNTYTTNDIIQVAYNNGAIWFGKNGTWQNSATESEIAAGTTTNAAYTGITTSDLYHIAWNGLNTSGVYLNAGQGYFGTTQVSSPQNPSSGDTSAIFEYTPPTGLQPVTTKGLNA